MLYHRRSGRHLPISDALLEALNAWSAELAPPPDLKGLVGRLASLYMLENTPLNLENSIPARSHLALLLPEGLWLPDPSQPSQGGHAFQFLPLNPQEIAFWRACNGARTVAQAARLAELQDAAPLLARLTALQAQAIQLRDRPITRRDPSLERVLAPQALLGHRDVDHYGSQGETTLEAWHGRIHDGERHFDDVETTVAHAFGLPHPALQDQRYGERLFDVFSDRGLIPDGLIVEVGPGDGELGQAFIGRSPTPLDYLRIDAAPELLRVQRLKMPGTREILGSATALPLPDRSVGLLFANEVIADLSALPYDPTHPAEAAEVEERLRRYKIQPEPGLQLYNLGAWRMLEEIARVLAPGGRAWLSEFGTLDEAPEETLQLDHPEVSIHFGQLQQVAHALNLSVRCEPLAEFMRFDLRALQLWRGSYEGLRARLKSEGRHLAARAYTPEQLQLPWPVEGLSWVPLSERGAGPLLTRFWCLTLHKV